jgi:hypothetical protein
MCCHCRAFDLVRQKAVVPRGCVQAVFKYEAFHEVVRLGLQADTVAAVRAAKPEETGMLIVRKVHNLSIIGLMCVVVSSLSVSLRVSGILLSCFVGAN